MIKNIWKMVKVYCGADHDELTELEVENGMYQLSNSHSCYGIIQGYQQIRLSG